MSEPTRAQAKFWYLAGAGSTPDKDREFAALWDALNIAYSLGGEVGRGPGKLCRGGCGIGVQDCVRTCVACTSRLAP